MKTFDFNTLWPKKNFFVHTVKLYNRKIKYVIKYVKKKIIIIINTRTSCGFEQKTKLNCCLKIVPYSLMMVSQSHFSSGFTTTTLSISSSASFSSSSFTTGSSFGPKSSGLRDLKQEADFQPGGLKQRGPSEDPHPLLLLLEEVVFDDLIQACTVRLDEAFHLRVVQSADLVIIELFIKLEHKKEKTFKKRRQGQRRNKRSPSQTGRPAATAAHSSASLMTSVSIL